MCFETSHVARAGFSSEARPANNDFACANLLPTWLRNLHPAIAVKPEHPPHLTTGAAAAVATHTSICAPPSVGVRLTAGDAAAHTALYAARQLATALGRMLAVHEESSRYLASLDFVQQAENRARQLVRILALKIEDRSEEMAVAIELLLQSQRQAQELLRNHMSTLPRAAATLTAASSACAAAEAVALSGVGAVPAMAALMMSVMVSKKAVQLGRQLAAAAASGGGMADQAAAATQVVEATQRALRCTLMAAEAQPVVAATAGHADGLAAPPHDADVRMGGYYEQEEYGMRSDGDHLMTCVKDEGMAPPTPGGICAEAGMPRPCCSGSNSSGSSIDEPGSDSPPPPPAPARRGNKASLLPAAAVPASGTNGSSGGVTEDPGKISADVLRLVYNRPLREAAQFLSVSVMSLKRSCRAQGVKRWPYRKLSCLRALEATVNEDPTIPRSDKQSLIDLINTDKARIMSDANHEMHPALNKMRLHKIKVKYERESRGKKKKATAV